MAPAPHGYHAGTSFPRKSPPCDGRTYGKCKDCGAKELVWELHPDGWRLVDVGGNRHVCKVRS